VPQGSVIASLFHDVADLGLLEAQNIGAIVCILWHIATYVRSWLQNSRNRVRLVEFDLVGTNRNRESDFFRISGGE
jgi:hypothetical protein